MSRIISILFLFLIAITCSCNKEYISDSQPEKDNTISDNTDYIVVLGDIQEYTAGTGYEPYFRKTMEWIKAQNDKSIKCILHVGDVTWHNAGYQWECFYNNTVSVAENILYITCTGNHDYDSDNSGNWVASKIYDRNSTHINEYAKFPLTEKNIVARFETDRIENIVVANEIKGERYDILVLEFGPRTEVLEWANKYVSKHNDRKYILLTHEFLSRGGERISANSFAELQLCNTTWSSPEDVWQKLVKDNDNIVCVLCGHNGFSTQLYSKNTAGREVPQILFNLQYQENGGDGMVQLWEFPEHGDSVSVRVYNTITHEFHSDPSTSFKFRYKY